MRKKKIKPEGPKPIPGVFSMQINVPHSVYGSCTHFMPDDLIDWIRSTMNLQEGEFVDYRYSGGTSGGDGFTNGVTNQETVYMVYKLKEHDGLAFKIQFPKCGVHMSQQYEYD